MVFQSYKKLIPQRRTKVERQIKWKDESDVNYTFHMVN